MKTQFLNSKLQCTCTCRSPTEETRACAVVREHATFAFGAGLARCTLHRILSHRVHDNRPPRRPAEHTRCGVCACGACVVLRWPLRGAAMASASLPCRDCARHTPRRPSSPPTLPLQYPSTSRWAHAAVLSSLTRSLAISRVAWLGVGVRVRVSLRVSLGLGSGLGVGLAMSRLASGWPAERAAALSRASSSSSW